MSPVRLLSIGSAFRAIGIAGGLLPPVIARSIPLNTS